MFRALVPFVSCPHQVARVLELLGGCLVQLSVIRAIDLYKAWTPACKVRVLLEDVAMNDRCPNGVATFPTKTFSESIAVAQQNTKLCEHNISPISVSEGNTYSCEAMHPQKHTMHYGRQNTRPAT